MCGLARLGAWMPRESLRAVVDATFRWSYGAEWSLQGIADVSGPTFGRSAGGTISATAARAGAADGRGAGGAVARLSPARPRNLMRYYWPQLSLTDADIRRIGAACAAYNTDHDLPVDRVYQSSRSPSSSANSRVPSPDDRSTMP